VGFPENVLTDDERVVGRVHPHWKVLILPVLWVVVAAVAVAAVWVLLPGWYLVARWVLTGLALAALIPLALRPWLVWVTTVYVLTNERVITRRGVFARTGRDIPLGRVNDVSFSHGLIDRMLGCGTLTIESAGERGQVVLNDIPGVERIQSLLYQLVEDDRERHSFGDEDRDRIVTQLREGQDPPAR
jgi:membrane protein YdbS with pleckstrin-like domain